MNDPTAQMMNQHQKNQALPPLVNQILPQMTNPVQLQQQPPQIMKRNYGMWAPPPQMPQPSMNQNKMKLPKYPKANVGGLGPLSNWMGKRVKGGKDGRRKDLSLASGSGGGGGGGGYQPPNLNELQHQNRVKAKRYFPKKKYNANYHTNYGGNNNGGLNMGKFAPRNTSSFLIRAKKSGGIAELVSPYPVTPAVLPTPMFSPSREVLVDMAKEEWGVDGYGSMKGLIRLRSPGRDDEGDDEEEDEGESSDSDVEDHVEVERRLDHDLSRFEMIYPNSGGGMEYNNLLENRVDDQDTHIAQLEEENLILKDRLFFMERELGDMRRRLQYLERRGHGGGEVIHEEVLENESDSETESRGESRPMGINHGEFVDENIEGRRDVKMGEEFEGNDENVTDKNNYTSELMDEILSKDVAAKDETDVGNSEKAVIIKGSELAADARLDNSVELENRTDTDYEKKLIEREVYNGNDESITKKCDQASESMDENSGNGHPIKDEKVNKNEEKIVNELGSAADAHLDKLSMEGEKKDGADNDAITNVEKSDE